MTKPIPSSTTASAARAAWSGGSWRLSLRRAPGLSAIVTEIEYVLEHNVLAEPNKAALARLKKAASRIPACQEEARELAYEIHDRATLFYSDDDHYHLRGGAAALYEQMRSDLLPRLRAIAAASPAA